jgi:hypothetical protein
MSPLDVFGATNSLFTIDESPASYETVCTSFKNACVQSPQAIVDAANISVDIMVALFSYTFTNSDYSPKYQNCRSKNGRLVNALPASTLQAFIHTQLLYGLKGYASSRKSSLATAVSEIAALPMKDLDLVHVLMDLKLIERKGLPNFFFL